MSLSHIPIGEHAPQMINVVIEIPRGSHHKYEFDPEINALRLDRVLHSPVYYPTEYGFIPETLSEDGDHLDALVLITEPLIPGCVITVKPIGVLDMEDDKGKDPKIITVATNDPKLANVHSLEDVDPHYKREIEAFFRQYKELENKMVVVKNWLPLSDALTCISSAMERYSTTHT